MKASDAFPSRYLQTSVVKGKPIVAAISHVEMETVGQGADQKRKPVLYLDGHKPMVLNRTNFETLADAFGDSDEWAGNKVKVFTARTQYQGKSIDGLRVEPIKPKPAETEDDFIPDEIPAF
jgi:hypothetical protein